MTFKLMKNLNQQTIVIDSQMPAKPPYTLMYLLLNADRWAEYAARRCAEEDHQIHKGMDICVCGKVQVVWI